MDLYPNPTPPASDMSSFFRFLPGIDTSEYHHYFHTDLETPQTVPWTGLEASTRAYAKIIDEVNKLPLSTFQRPEEPTRTSHQAAVIPSEETPMRNEPCSASRLVVVYAAAIVPWPRSSRRRCGCRRRNPLAALYPLDDALLQWPLPAGGQAYADIDGKHLHAYVVDQAAISRRYRDQGHPQFWGRITGTSVGRGVGGLAGRSFQAHRVVRRAHPADRFAAAVDAAVVDDHGDVRRDDAAARSIRGAGVWHSRHDGPDGLDVDAVWVGTGSDADFAGRDVRGKAVFMFSMALPGSMNNTSTLEGGPKRAETRGAAAVFEVIALPGNSRNMLYPVRVNVPVFALGMEDGYAIRDLIGTVRRAGRRRVRIRLDVQTGAEREVGARVGHAAQARPTRRST